MKLKKLTAALLLLVCSLSYGAAKIQNEDIKSLADLTGAGGNITQLPNDSKVYLTNASLAVQLSTAIASGDVYSSVLPPIFRQSLTPANPAAGFNKCYTKADDKFYCLNSAGVESLVGPTAGTTGTPNTFSYYNALGNLVTLPTWLVNTLDGNYGAQVYQTINVPVDAGPVTNKIESYEAEIIPVQTTSQYQIYGFNIDNHFDRSNANFDFNNNIFELNTNFGHEGSGHVNNMTNWNANFGMGQGDPGSITDANFIAANVSVGANFTLTNYNAISHTFTIDPAATFTNFFGLSLSSSGAIAGNYQGSLINQVGNVGGSYSGSQVNLNGDVATNATTQTLSMTGNVTNDYTVTNSNSTGNVGGNYITRADGVLGDVTGNATFMSSAMTGNVGGNFNGIFLQQTGSSVNWTGMTVSQLGAGSSGTAEGFRSIFANGNTTGKTGITLLMGDGVSSGSGRIVDGNFSDGNYDNRIGFNLQGGTGDVTTSDTGLNIGQSTGTSGSFSGVNVTGAGTTGAYSGVVIQPSGGTATSATGLNVTLSSISTPGTQKSGLTINDGTLNSNAQYDTANLSATPGFGQMNYLGGAFQVSLGSPMSVSAMVLNNFAGVATFNDDMGPDALGGFLGYTNVGYIGQVAVAAGKTVDHINMAAAGASIPSGSGSVTTADMYAAAGLLPAGGTLSIGTLSGFHATSSLCSSTPTNCYSLFSEDTAAILYNVGAIRSNTSLILEDPGVGTNKWTIQSPTLAADYTLTLPVDDGAAGQVLSTNGAGVTSWVNAPAAAALSIVTKNAAYTVTDADDIILVDASGGPVTITLHDPDTAAVKRYSIKKIDSSTNLVTIDVTTGDNIDGDLTQIIGAQNQSLDLIPDTSTNDWYIF